MCNPQVENYFRLKSPYSALFGGVDYFLFSYSNLLDQIPLLSLAAIFLFMRFGF